MKLEEERQRVVLTAHRGDDMSSIDDSASMVEDAVEHGEGSDYSLFMLASVCELVRKQQRQVPTDVAATA